MMKFSLRKMPIWLLWGGVVTACSVPILPEKTQTSEQAVNTGQLVVYTDNVHTNETISIFIDRQFMASLPPSTQFQQALCAGSYQLKARPIQSSQNIQPVVPIETEISIQLSKGQTHYFRLSKTHNSWEFTPTHSITTDTVNSKTNLIRRITHAMSTCR